jgi:hypothetical protein
MSALPTRAELTDEERGIIDECRTPEAVQEFLNTLAYSFEPDGIERIRSLRRTARDRVAHCFEGALAAAGILHYHGYPPLILCMEASDLDHKTFLYQQDGRYGAVAQSRDENLKGRAAVFKTVRDLVMSYYPHYWNYFTGDRNDLTLRGFTAIDLGAERNWITAEEDLWFVDDQICAARFEALFPQEGKTAFLSNKDGSITWLQ